MNEETMHRKLATRLVLLFALLVTLAYLKSPTRSYATSCEHTCLNEEHACVASCPPGESYCDNECILEFKQCVNGCN